MKREYTKLVEEKINEVTSTIARLKTDDTITKATRGTQLYARSRERKVLRLVNELLSQIPNLKLTKDGMDTLVLITTLSSERAANTFTATAGEPFIDVMKRYPKRNIASVTNALEKLGLKINEKTGLIEEV